MHPITKINLLTFMVFLLLLLPVVGSTVYFTALQEQTLSDHSQATERQVRARLKEQVELRLALLETVARELELGILEPETSFKARAAQLQRHFGGYQAINFISPEGIIQQVVPREPNLDALGRDVSQHPQAARAFAQAQQQRQLVLTPPLTLFQGGQGFTCYVPVKGGEAGFVNGVFRYDPMFQVVFDEDLTRDFAVQMQIDGVSIFRAGEPCELAKPTMNRGTWRGYSSELRLQPTAALYRRYHPRSAYLLPILGFLGALALAGSVNLELRRQRRRRLQAAQQERARRLEALGTLAGGIAHDFNNLLTILGGTLEINLAVVEPGSLLQEDLKLLLETTRRASSLTSQLLIFSRNQLQPQEDFALGPVLGSTVELLQRLLPENIQLEKSCDVGDAWIKGQPGDLEQALVNLATNARDAMPEGGHLAMRAHREGQVVRLVLQDDGQGMDQETLERVFDPFFTTKEVGRGTGLGMVMVQRTVQQLRGEIKIQSQPGQGTTITLELPCAQPPQAATPQPKALESVRPGLILLVEDDEAIRATFTRALRQHGHQVLTAANGLEALELLEQPLELLLTDLIMPHMGGQELALRFLGQHPGGAVLFCSGYTDRALELPAQAITAVVAKPASLSLLVENVHHLLRRSRQERSPQVPDAPGASPR